MKPEIIFEDNYILVVYKPPGWVVPGLEFNESIEKWATERLSQQPGKFRLGLPHRLDRLTSGIVLLSKKAQTLKDLSLQFEQRTIQKKYVAIVQGTPSDESGRLIHYIEKNNTKQRADVFEKGGTDRKYAELAYQTIVKEEKTTLLDIQLLTGRYHQIRAQFSHIGHPVLGDRKYDSEAPFYPFYALHSYALTFIHPKSKERMVFTQLPPDRSFWKPYRDILQKKM